MFTETKYLKQNFIIRWRDFFLVRVSDVDLPFLFPNFMRGFTS